MYFGGREGARGGEGKVICTGRQERRGGKRERREGRKEGRKEGKRKETRAWQWKGERREEREKKVKEKNPAGILQLLAFKFKKRQIFIASRVKT